MCLPLGFVVRGLIRLVSSPELSLPPSLRRLKDSISKSLNEARGHGGRSKSHSSRALCFHGTP